MSETLKGNNDIEAGNSEFNQLEFFIQNLIKANVNTALPVRVVAVQAGGAGDKAGTVDCVPLIQGYDGKDKAVPVTNIFAVPYTRIQGGVCAFVVDPEPGDMGIAVFAQQDISGLSEKESKPLTKRSFSMADAMYIGGISNKKPEAFVEITKEQDINITCKKLTIKASGGISIEATAGTQMQGGLSATEDIKSGTISLQQHVHSGIQPGGGDTQKPVG